MIAVGALSLVASAAGPANAQYRHDDTAGGQSDNGQHDNGQYGNGQYGNGQYGNGHHDNGGRNNGRHNGWGQDYGGGDHHWRRGQRMGYNDWSGARVIDYREHRLRQPPRGYEWREANGQYVMAAIATGVIASIIINNGR